MLLLHFVEHLYQTYILFGIFLLDHKGSDLAFESLRFFSLGRMKFQSPFLRLLVYHLLVFPAVLVRHYQS